jgi:hypothetical protein
MLDIEYNQLLIDISTSITKSLLEEENCTFDQNVLQLEVYS